MLACGVCGESGNTTRGPPSIGVNHNEDVPKPSCLRIVERNVNAHAAVLIVPVCRAAIEHARDLLEHLIGRQHAHMVLIEPHHESRFGSRSGTQLARERDHTIGVWAQQAVAAAMREQQRRRASVRRPTSCSTRRPTAWTAR